MGTITQGDWSRFSNSLCPHSVQFPCAAFFYERLAPPLTNQVGAFPKRFLSGLYVGDINFQIRGVPTPLLFFFFMMSRRHSLGFLSFMRPCRHETKQVFAFACMCRQLNRYVGGLMSARKK